MKNKKITKDYFINADSEKAKDIQLQLIRAMNYFLQQEGKLDEDEFEIFVEDTLENTLVPVRTAQKLLEITGAYIHDDKKWTYNHNLKYDGSLLDWEEYIALFEERRAIGDLNKDSKEAILSGIRWTIKVALFAEESKMKGMPAFFACNEKEDSPIGVNIAGTATSDALSLLCSSPECLADCGIPSEEIIRCISFLLEKTIACRSISDGWDLGGFYPLEDQQESFHPTVDATCLAVMALCTFYEKRKMIEQKLSASFDMNYQEIENAIIDGLGFLFRMQLEAGCFGIYKYENGVEAPPNENCTRMVQSTMGVCKGSGIFDQIGREDLYSACSQVIGNTYTFLCTHTADAGLYRVWAPYFGNKSQDYSIPDVIVSTARVCRSFIPVWWQMDNERENIKRYNQDFIRFWMDKNDRILNRVGRYRFNSPAKDGFSVGEYFWAAQADVLAAFSVLQAFNMFDITLSNEDWKLIDETVRKTMELQHQHGHWDNPLAVKTPFCAATLAAIELLQEYRLAKGYT